MRISDWSSDVCSSDLGCPLAFGSERRAGCFKPGLGLARKLWTNDIQYACMIAVQPSAFVLPEHRDIHQMAVDGREGQRLETKHLPHRSGSLALFDQPQIFDASSVFYRFLITRILGK